MHLQLADRNTANNAFVDVLNYELVANIARSTPDSVKFINVATDAIAPTTPDTVLFYPYYAKNIIRVCGKGRGSYPDFTFEVQGATCKINGLFYSWQEDLQQWLQWTYLTKDDEAKFYAYNMPNITAILPTWSDKYVNLSPDFMFYANQKQDIIWVTFDNKVITVTGARFFRYKNRLQVYALDSQYWQDADKFFTDTRKATISNLCRNQPTIEHFVEANFIAPESNELKFYAIKGQSNIIAAQLGQQTNIDQCFVCIYQDNKFSFIDDVNVWTGNHAKQFHQTGDTGGKGSIDLPLFNYRDINTAGDELINIQANYHFTQRASTTGNPNTPNLICDFSNMPEVASFQFVVTEQHLYINTTGTASQYATVAKQTINANTGTIRLANDSDGLNYIYHKFECLCGIKLFDSNGVLLRKYFINLDALVNQGVKTNYDTEIAGDARIKRVL